MDLSEYKLWRNGTDMVTDDSRLTRDRDYRHPHYWALFILNGNRLWPFRVSIFLISQTVEVVD
jgi:hypothetical protein